MMMVKNRYAVDDNEIILEDTNNDFGGLVHFDVLIVSINISYQKYCS
jgi:hypothetical protein